jgi:hypothetical protein
VLGIADLVAVRVVDRVVEHSRDLLVGDHSLVTLSLLVRGSLPARLTTPKGVKQEQAC